MRHSPPPIPNEGSGLATIIYWARYKGFWFQAISRILGINGTVGALLWATDELTGAHNPTLLEIRGNLPLTLFLAALIALAYAVVRLALQLDPDEPSADKPALVLLLLVIVAVTSISGPVFVAIGEAGVLLVLLAVLWLRKWEVDSFIVLKGVLIAGGLVLVAGLAIGIATGELLQTRFSPTGLVGAIRLLVFLLGLSVYLLEERRHWNAEPPTPAVVERLHLACKHNDFGAISRWLADDLTFSQADQRMLAQLILPRRLVVDGDVALAPTPEGGVVLVRVIKGRVTELRTYLPAPGT
ncbi:MAG: hypothetical protein ACYDAG_11665 [Chloroflexota bacterium]